MENLLDKWNKIEKKIKKSRHILLLFDYDGTLTPIVSAPGKAHLDDKTRKILKKISAKPQFSVGIVSGRLLDDVKGKVKLENIIYIGNHGFEIEAKIGRDSIPKKLLLPDAVRARPFIQNILKILKDKLKNIKGVILENKNFTVSVHYRLVKSSKIDSVKKIVKKAIKPYLDINRIGISTGKKVIEIRPPIQWNKGKAVLWIIEAIKQKNLLPIYLGDDKTDEDVFEVLRNKGITVKIARKTGTKAEYILKNVQEVEKFLELVNKI